MSFTVYILRTSSNTLYIGQTNNLQKRIKEHQSKTSKSARYIKYFDSCKLVYSEKYPTRVEAMRREWQLKHWTKAKKELGWVPKVDFETGVRKTLEFFQNPTKTSVFRVFRE